MTQADNITEEIESHNIGLRNGILAPKHLEQMGMSIWLYSWFILRVTKVDNGIGKVLGGKPIKYETDIKPDLGINRAKYVRWIAALEQYGYIDTTRTPYGLVVRVTKAKKNFMPTQKRSYKNVTTEPSDVTEMQQLDVTEIEHQDYKNVTSNKDKIEDKINTNTIFSELAAIIQPKARYSDAYGKLVKKALKTLNPDELLMAARYFTNQFTGNSDWHSKSENQKYKTINQFLGMNKDRIPRYETCFSAVEDNPHLAKAKIVKVIDDAEIEARKAQDAKDLAERQAKLKQMNGATA